MSADLTIGQRVKQIRTASNISRADLAGRVDRSVDWLKSVEIGRRQLDRYSTIAAVAAALGCEVTELLAVPHRSGASIEQRRAHAAVPALRRVLLRADLPPRAAGAPIDLDALRSRVDVAHRYRRHARYGDLAADLPQLLQDVAHTTAVLEGREKERAFALLAEARHDAAMMAKRLGYVDLAAMAAAQGVRAANASGDPLLVTALTWTQAEVYITAGAVDEAHEITTGQMDVLDPLLGDGSEGIWSLWGTLHLVESVIQARRLRGAEAASHLVEAAAAASRVGSGHSEYQTEFGPENRAIVAVHVGLELGGGREALSPVDDAVLSGLPKERRARHAIDRALAASRDGDDLAAMGELLEADKIAPEAVRNHPIARELVVAAAHRSRTVKEPIVTAATRLGVSI
ncbi:helix-turn-helix domain-containing protein [Actinomadura roseirufa]|uniref:helix-turn-helix domain-containing protein n=1 Tax=Actinomadura roseirufa TaxID=2094049 RepID=UPI0013F17775|nr:helix-turn-helix transcriptional regulator [Actinomadura roseirufa]